MARRQMRQGICKLCKRTKPLSYEHIPPRAAFNTMTKFRVIPFIEYIENSRNPNYKPTAKIQQGGLGEYCLCQKCNSFLGQNYVGDYLKLALYTAQILKDYNPNKVCFNTSEIYPLKLLKQIISMIICINGEVFTDIYPELLPFINDRNSQHLPDKFRVLIYLNRHGKIRNIPMVVHNVHGIVSEFAFPPLGIVLLVDSQRSYPELFEITNFKQFGFDDKKPITFLMHNLPTHTMFPVDYRTEEEIEETVRQSEEYMRQHGMS